MTLFYGNMEIHGTGEIVMEVYLPCMYLPGM